MNLPGLEFWRFLIDKEMFGGASVAARCFVFLHFGGGDHETTAQGHDSTSRLLSTQAWERRHGKKA